MVNIIQQENEFWIFPPEITGEEKYKFIKGVKDREKKDKEEKEKLNG